MNLNKRLKYTIIIVLTVVFIGGVSLMTYLGSYYRASAYVETIIQESELEITYEGALTTIRPSAHKDLDLGFIFYPGGKVEAKAYVPLLLQLAEEGLTCVMVEMPGNLAVFDINGAEKAFFAHPELTEWYIGGHSLGGAMASTYMEGAYEKVDGLILLGAYPTNDAPVESLAIYGSSDLMLNREKLVLADQVYEVVGGNHAQFGDYGRQEGDGEAEISRKEQQAQTVERILEFVQK